MILIGLGATTFNLRVAAAMQTLAEPG